MKKSTLWAMGVAAVILAIIGGVVILKNNGIYQGSVGGQYREIGTGVVFSINPEGTEVGVVVNDLVVLCKVNNPEAAFYPIAIGLNVTVYQSDLDEHYECANTAKKGR